MSFLRDYRRVVAIITLNFAFLGAFFDPMALASSFVLSPQEALESSQSTPIQQSIGGLPNIGFVTFTPKEELYVAGRAARLRTEQIDQLYRIMLCESGGNPKIPNKHSTAKGLFQFLDSSWDTWGNGKDVFDQAANVDAAIRYYKHSGTRPWAQCDR